MQLPKAQGTSNRTSEFAADSAAITAAIEDHLLPKPSLDFGAVSGSGGTKDEALQRLRRPGSLSGPIGVMVAPFFSSWLRELLRISLDGCKVGAKSFEKARRTRALSAAALLISSLGRQIRRRI